MLPPQNSCCHYSADSGQREFPGPCGRVQGLVCAYCRVSAGGGCTCANKIDTVSSSEPLGSKCTALEKSSQDDEVVTEIGIGGCYEHSVVRKDVRERKVQTSSLLRGEREWTRECQFAGGGRQRCCSKESSIEQPDGVQRAALIPNGRERQSIRAHADYKQGSCDLSCDHIQGSCDLGCDHMHGSCDLQQANQPNASPGSPQRCTSDCPPPLLLHPPHAVGHTLLGQLQTVTLKETEERVQEKEETVTIVSRKQADAQVRENGRPFPTHGGLALRDLTPSEVEDQSSLTMTEAGSSVCATPLRGHLTHVLQESCAPAVCVCACNSCKKGSLHADLCDLPLPCGPPAGERWEWLCVCASATHTHSTHTHTLHTQRERELDGRE